MRNTWVCPKVMVLLTFFAANKAALAHLPLFDDGTAVDPEHALVISEIEGRQRKGAMAQRDQTPRPSLRLSALAFHNPSVLAVLARAGREFKGPLPEPRACCCRNGGSQVCPNPNQRGSPSPHANRPPALPTRSIQSPPPAANTFFPNEATAPVRRLAGETSISHASSERSNIQQNSRTQ